MEKHSDDFKRTQGLATSDDDSVVQSRADRRRVVYELLGVSKDEFANIILFKALERTRQFQESLGARRVGRQGNPDGYYNFLFGNLGWAKTQMMGVLDLDWWL